MAAAGLGNMISDLAGIGLADQVEAVCRRLGLPNPRLTPEQMKHSSTRWMALLVSSTKHKLFSLVPRPPSFPGLPRSQASVVPRPPSFPGLPRSQASVVPRPPSFPGLRRSQASLVPRPPSFPGLRRSQASLVPRPPSFPGLPRSQASVVPRPPSFPSLRTASVAYSAKRTWERGYEFLVL